MFTGRRPRAFQFNCCVGRAILGQALVARKTNRTYTVLLDLFLLGTSEPVKRNFCLGGA